VWEKVDILYTDQVLPQPEQAPAVGWIQFHWAGISHALQHPILQKPGLKITTLSGAVASKVAEYTVLLMLALSNHLSTILANQKKAEWPGDRWERLKPTELRGSTVGIVGYGSIGRQVARLLNTFGMEILAAKLDAKDPVDHGYTTPGWGDPQGDLVRRIYPIQALTWMVKESDFLVVTAPLTEQTNEIIGEEVFSSMKPTTFLVDVSRGGIVDHQALVRAIKDRKLAGAALDVFSKEPLPADSPLWKLPNVIISPHVAGITPHYDDRAVELFAQNLQRYMDDQPLLNLFSFERGY
jgi:phosphoglycerate dehydrogenase-like enzyme